MKIDFIISSLQGGGAERVLVLIANNLVKNKEYDVSVITLNKGKDVFDLETSIKKISLDHGRLPNHTIRGFLNLLKHYFIKKNRPDIIISFNSGNNLLTIPVAKLYSIKIIAEEHISYIATVGNKSFKQSFARKYLYKKADVVTVLTEHDVDHYKKLGVNVTVMPNPCSFDPLKENNTNREKIILAVGSLNRYHHKGFDNLLHLIAPILKKNPEWKLKIAGSGDKGYEILQELKEKLDIENQVIFTGFVSNISDIMRKSSIFILSSRFEGLPMVLLEAMSQGMACIAYDCKTGPSDIITDGINGFLIEDQNKISMQKKLQNLIDNESLINTFAQESLYSIDKYHISSVIKRYEDVFENLLQKK